MIHGEKQFQQIAYALAHAEYGLKDDEFVIRLWSARQGRGWNVQRGKSVTRIYFSVGLFDNDFETKLRGALAAARQIKKTKMTDVVMFDGLKVPPREVTAAYRTLYNLPPLLERSELDVRMEYQVTLKHRETGVVLVKTGPIKANGLTNLIEKGREEITEQVIEVVKKIADKQQQEVK